ncbi:hypothetical protein [Microbacterium sp. AG157]|uniref:hypothetical protein n=1 Tax=Microbacterium sp. AG157 TaxID=2183993 RepID=UPI000E23E3B6|nr:hypothetical protein [Microbacterium sp. AG157]
MGFTDATVALDSLAEVRVYPHETIVLESTGVRRLTVVDGDIRDAKVTDPRERERLTRLFNEDG